jgi:hypothetical protein
MAFWLCGKNAGKIMNLIFRYIQKAEYLMRGRAECRLSYDNVGGRASEFTIDFKRLRAYNSIHSVRLCDDRLNPGMHFSQVEYPFEIRVGKESDIFTPLKAN